MTYDQAFKDSAGAFAVSQLEKLDPKINEPLVSIQYTRDVTLREDVTIADEFASFTIDSFAAKQGSTGGYINKSTNTVGEVGVDVKKVRQDLHLWSKKASWTMPELASSMQLGRPIDVSKIMVLSKNFQMDCDAAFAIGSTVHGTTGLFNNANVSTANAPTGTWSTATADQILADVNEVLTRAYEASAYAVAPTDLRVDPTSFGTLSTKKVSDAGNISVLEYVKQNCISNTINSKPLNIQPSKWLASGQAVSNKNRMVAYTNDPQYVQFPVVPLQRQQPVPGDISMSVAYLGSIGQVEIRYEEVVAYSDGI